MPKKNMKLGIDASRANVQKKTGVEWYAWRIIQELKTIIPADTQVILYSREPLEGSLAQLPENWVSRVIKTPGSRFWTQIGLSLEMWRRPIDVLFVPAHVIPLWHPKKTIATVHDVASKRYPKSYSRFARFYHSLSTRHIVKRAWSILVPSRFTAQEIHEFFGRPAGDITVVHLGSDATTASLDTPTVPVPDSPYIVHVGRLERKKGTVDLIRAFEILKEDPAHQDLLLLLVGSAGHGFSEIEQMIVQSPYRGAIMRLGWLPESNKQILLRGAHMYVFPSQYEGFGVPLLEAAACGVPVVARRVGSLPEIAGHNLVRWYDQPHQLSSVLKEALLDKHWHFHVKTQGPRHATRFTWRASALRTWEVLRRALVESDR